MRSCMLRLPHKAARYIASKRPQATACLAFAPYVGLAIGRHYFKQVGRRAPRGAATCSPARRGAECRDRFPA